MPERVLSTQNCSRCEKTFEYLVTKSGKLRKFCDECSKIPVLTWEKQETLRLLGGKCVVCGEGRILERAHFVPRRFLGVEGLERLKNANGHNILPLCPTHHRLFDLYQLTEEEKKKIVRFMGHNAYLAVESVETTKPVNGKDEVLPPEHKLWESQRSLIRSLNEWLGKQDMSKEKMKLWLH